MVGRTKRNRGRSLEVERIDSSINSNQYDKDNCKLACYFCNNHKSDVISKNDLNDFFKIPMFNYLKKLSKTKNPDFKKDEFS